MPPLRVHRLGDSPIRAERGRYVLYWMTAARRATWNFALDHAADLALGLGVPLVVFEPLRVDHRWASARFHRFVIEGMADNRAAFRDSEAAYLPYVEPTPGAGRDVFAALAARAAIVVTDEYPCFFLPRMQAASAERLGVAMDVVDGLGLLPLRALPVRDGRPRRFERAVDFRRHLQHALPDHLGETPRPDGVHGLGLPPASDLATAAPFVAARSDVDARLRPGGLDALPVDHGVGPVASTPGGSVEAARRLERFVGERLARYHLRNRPESPATSGLSPHLHFGHVGAHQVVHAVTSAESWTPDSVWCVADGSRSGWWCLSENAEAFLDQVVTWRELCAHTCHVLPSTYDAWESLPAWARRTLDDHTADPREHLYSTDQLDAAATHDPLWNAAQSELRATGTIHTYLRMLWGKKVLEWSASPRQALHRLIELNDRYALDGRDPNSYGGILWTLGRHDRAWGPERPVFGKVRFMSSANTARKVRVKLYIDRWLPESN